jgi:APA family basic amino acid/polyamine antiporter
MMVSLGVATWWRLIIWTIVGLIVYLAYGRKHSRVGAAMNDAAAKASPATIR